MKNFPVPAGRKKASPEELVYWEPDMVTLTPLTGPFISEKLEITLSLWGVRERTMVVSTEKKGIGTNLNNGITVHVEPLIRQYQRMISLKQFRDKDHSLVI
jgi:hypothetical protein